MMSLWLALTSYKYLCSELHRAEYMYKHYIDDIFQFKNNYAYLRDQFFLSFLAAKKYIYLIDDRVWLTYPIKPNWYQTLLLTCIYHTYIITLVNLQGICLGREGLAPKNNMMF